MIIDIDNYGEYEAVLSIITDEAKVKFAFSVEELEQIRDAICDYIMEREKNKPAARVCR